MKSANNAFILWESLLALLVFGFILAWYLPALTLQSQKIMNQDQSVRECRLFYQCIYLWTEGQEDYIDVLLARWDQLNPGNPVTAYLFSPESSYLMFRQGGQYAVQIQPP